MSLDRMFDPNALLLVVLGTLAATLLRSGFGEIANTGRALASLFRPRFSEARARAALAAQARHIDREGMLRAPLATIPDRDLSQAVEAMLQRRSIDALTEHHETSRIARERIAADGTRLFNLAADLSPVFGLAGTLVALTQLPAGGLAPEAISAAVSSAVLTTLYGVLSANLVYAPIARHIARIAESEEAGRQAMVDWLQAQIAPAPAIARPTRTMAA
jgi:chemotaxis protein MotA